jgi:excisionase family DNA binding protein
MTIAPREGPSVSDLHLAVANRQYIDTAEAAVIARCSTSTIRRLLKARTLKTYKPGLKRVLIDRQELECHIRGGQP